MAGSRTFTWNPERVAMLQSLYEEGLGPSEIARRMGLTKGEVAGRMSRQQMTDFGAPKSTFAQRMDAYDRLLPPRICSHDGCRAAADPGRRHCVEHRWYPPIVLDEAAE